MKAIIVDDEHLMLRSFERYSSGVKDLELVGSFDDPVDALDYVKTHRVDVAFLDIEMPGMNGLGLTRYLRKAQPDIRIVFVTAYDNYIKESNELDADYYLMKPYKADNLEKIAARLRRLVKVEEAKKDIYIQCFGRFTVFYQGKPVALQGKAKEILAMVVTRRGKELSNEELYTTIWENREYSNIHMKVYYNALKRLRTALEAAGLQDLLVSTTRGQLINVDVIDCDYYAWQDGNMTERDRFEGEFLSEYSWAESMLADILARDN